MKREVAAYEAGFPRSECQVRKTGDKSLYKATRSTIYGSRNDVRACKKMDRCMSIIM